MKYLIDIHHGLGDVIHFLPAIKAIKEKDKSAYIILLISKKYIGDFVIRRGYVDGVIVLTRENLLIKIISALFNKMDYGIVAPCISNQKKAKILLKLLGCKKILLESDVKTKHTHRVDRNNALLTLIDISVRDKTPKITVLEDSIMHAESYLINLNPELKTIAFCMGGNPEKHTQNGLTEYVDVKRWNVGYFHELIGMVASLYNVVLIGGEKDYNDYILSAQKDSDTVLNMMGKTSVDDSTAILSFCDLVVGNDTGMMHIAAAIGKPTMTIFCSTNPQIIGAYAENAIYIEEYLPCKYCYLSSKTFECKKKECLTQIKPEVVYKQVINYFNKQG